MLAVLNKLTMQIRALSTSHPQNNCDQGSETWLIKRPSSLPFKQFNFRPLAQNIFHTKSQKIPGIIRLFHLLNRVDHSGWRSSLSASWILSESYAGCDYTEQEWSRLEQMIQLSSFIQCSSRLFSEECEAALTEKFHT